jgi:hypothetical protein
MDFSAEFQGLDSNFFHYNFNHLHE